MIEIDIVTPSRKIVEGVKTLTVKLPAAKGEIEVLPGHTELLTMLTAGTVSFVQDGRERKFAMSYGFAEVRKDKILVLGETVEESKEIDRQRAIEAQQKAQERLSGALTQEEFRKHKAKLQRAIVRQNVAG